MLAVLEGLYGAAQYGGPLSGRAAEAAGGKAISKEKADRMRKKIQTVIGSNRDFLTKRSCWLWISSSLFTTLMIIERIFPSL